MHLSHLFNLPQRLLQINLFIAQATPTPTSTPKPSPTPADVELLNRQIQFLQDANTRLNNSFGSFVSAINLSFVVLGIIFAIVGAVSIYFFNQSLKEARQMVRNEGILTQSDLSDFVFEPGNYIPRRLLRMMQDVKLKNIKKRSQTLSATFFHTYL